VALPSMPLCEHVVEDYAATGLSLKAHPVGFFRDRLMLLGAISNAAHRQERYVQDQRVTVAGLVLVRQIPGTAKGGVFMASANGVWATGPRRRRRKPQTLLSGRRCSRETAAPS